MLNGAASSTLLCGLDQVLLCFEHPEGDGLCRVGGSLGETVGPFGGSQALPVARELNGAPTVEVSVCIPTVLTTEKYRVVP